MTASAVHYGLYALLLTVPGLGLFDAWFVLNDGILARMRL